MTKSELLGHLAYAKGNRLIRSVAEEAEKLISDGDVEIVFSEDTMPVEHYIAIWKRRLRHSTKSENYPRGMEATVANLEFKSGMLRLGYVKKAKLLIGFWMDDDSNLQGCIIGLDNRE